MSQLGRLNFKPAAGQVSETNISVVSANVNDAGKMSKEVEKMSKSKELYLGRCFTLTTAFGSLRKISLGPQDLQKLNDFAADNKGWANILVKMKKSFNAGESDFYVEIDPWKPDGEVKNKDLPF